MKRQIKINVGKNSSVISCLEIFLLIFTLPIWFGGCSDGGGNGYPAYTGQAYLDGEMHGELAEALSDSLICLKSFNDQASDGLVIISLKEGDSIDAETCSGLKGTFENGQPVAIEHATEEEVNMFLSALGLDPNFIMDKNLSPELRYVELYGVEKREGDLHVWITENDNSPSAELTPGLERENLDDQEIQTERAMNFIDWVIDGENQSAVFSEENEKLKQVLSRDSGGSVELTELASARVETRDASWGGQNFQVISSVYSCHDFSGGDDYFLIKQSAMLNPSGRYSRTEGHGTTPTQVKGYMVRYGFDNYWEGIPSSSEAVLLKSSPENANGRKTVESGMDWNIGGEVGYDGKRVGGGLSGGVTFKSSESVTIEDCTVENKSAAGGSSTGFACQAAWIYNFNRPADGTHYFSWQDLNDAPLLARSNFQPVQYWIWKTYPAMRTKLGNNPRFVTKFKWTSGVSYGAKGAFWIEGGASHNDWESLESKFYLPVNLPPLIVTGKSQLDFGCYGSYQTLEFAAGKDWAAESDQAWCELDSSSGAAGGGLFLHVTVEENTTGTNRNAMLTLKTCDGKESRKVKVFQSRY